MPGAQNLARGKKQEIGSRETAETGTDTEGAENGREKRGLLGSMMVLRCGQTLGSKTASDGKDPTLARRGLGALRCVCSEAQAGPYASGSPRENRLEGRVSAPRSGFHQPYGTVYE